MLKKAKEETPNLTEQINQLSSSLGACAHVCDQVNKHVAHTANPETCRDWKEWDIDLQDLEKAHKSAASEILSQGVSNGLKGKVEGLLPI